MSLWPRVVVFVAGLIGLSISRVASGGCEPGWSLGLPIMVVEGVPLVRLSVKDKEAVLILDTGAESTILTTAAADRLQLQRSIVYPRHLRGVNGAIVGGAVQLPGLAIGGARLPNFGALVGSIDLPKVGGIVPDGLLGADILSDFDVEIDLAYNLVRLACATGAPSWARPYTALEANRSLHDRLFFRAKLDGKSVAVIIDTGAQHSVIDREAAAAIGVDLQMLSRAPVSPVRGIAGVVEPEARPYRFGELVIGDKTLSSPTLLVTSLRLTDADLILGADFLKVYRVWLSYKAHKIFVARRS